MKNTIALTLALSVVSLIYSQELKLPDRLLTSAVLVTADNGNIGSGFFMESDDKLFFITASHVLAELKDSKEEMPEKVEVLFYSEDIVHGKPSSLTLLVKTSLDAGLLKYSKQHDVITIYIGNLTPDSSSRFHWINFLGNVSMTKSSFIPYLSTANMRSYEDSNIGDVIYLFGYPASLGLSKQPQFDYQRPLLRRGIIAGKYEGRKSIIIDCPVYQGNSGGPVWEKVEVGNNILFYLLGVAIEYVPYVQQWQNKRENVSNYEIANSGYSIVTSIEYVIELIKSFKSK